MISMYHWALTDAQSTIDGITGEIIFPGCECVLLESTEENTIKDLVLPRIEP